MRGSPCRRRILWSSASFWKACQRTFTLKVLILYRSTVAGGVDGQKKATMLAEALCRRVVADTATGRSWVQWMRTRIDTALARREQ